jgi:transposase-like protein
LEGWHERLISRNTRLSSSKRRFGWGVSSAAKSLGIPGQTLHNWVKADAVGRLRDVAGKTISAEQMEIARLKAELARTRTERDILKKAAAYFARESL